MTLKQDERALLQLLLERDQSYDDLAELLGSERDEVRARARAALTELGGADPDAEVGLSDYLLGQADPIARADAVRHLQDDPEALDLARGLETKLRALAPEGTLPSLPEPRGGRRRPGGPERAAAADAGDAEPAVKGGGLLGTLDRRQGRVLAGLGAAAVLVLAIVLGVAGAFSGDDSSDEPEASAGDIVTVELTAQGNGSASGEAVFDQTDTLQPFVQLSATGLPAPTQARPYTLWLLLPRRAVSELQLEGANQAGLPVAFANVDRNGNLDERLAIPTDFAAVLPLADRVVLARTNNDELRDEIDTATQANVPVVPLIGTTELAGQLQLGSLQAPAVPGGSTDGTAPPTDQLPGGSGGDGGESGEDGGDGSGGGSGGG